MRWDLVGGDKSCKFADMEMRYSIEHWVVAFRSLNINRHHGMVAPHKAVLLLAVMAQIERGELQHCFVPCDEAMEKAYIEQWKRHVGIHLHYQPAFQTPFQHMPYEGFWTLIKTPDYRRMTEYGLKALRTSFYGAFVDPNLWEAMTEPASRRLLRRTLLETYLPHSKDAGKEGSENYERPSIAAEPATDAIISRA